MTDIEKFERIVAGEWHRAGRPALLLCLSGGSDSVALLLSLREAVGERCCMTALHCNFHLRGDESERDRQFVEDLCQRLNVPLKVKDFDVYAYQSQNKCSLETACRELRYAWFREELSLLPSPARIVTGHHADDNIETLLLNLFRGSGVEGLKGMLPDTGEILRPLLSISRDGILAYLDAKGESYVTDSTNLMSDYRRNFIRNELIPLAETRWPGLRKSLRRSQLDLRDDAALLRSVADQVSYSSLELPLSDLRQFDSFSSIIYRWIAPHGGNSQQARGMAAAIMADPFQSGKSWPMPDGSTVSLDRDALRVNPSTEAADATSPVFCWGEVTLSDTEKKRMKSDRTNMQAWLPRGAEAYRFRRFRHGDRISPLGMKGSRLLSDILKDAHLSVAEKDAQWVLEDVESGRIIWVPGHCRSRYDLVDLSAESCHIVTYLKTFLS